MKTVLVFTLFAVSTAATQPSNPTAAIIGAWECTGGPCIDPEIEFAVQNGARVFKSWLRQRPASSGTWLIKDTTVTITLADHDYAYRIVQLNKDRLVLRGESDRESARYRRIVE